MQRRGKTLWCFDETNIVLCSAFDISLDEHLTKLQQHENDLRHSKCTDLYLDSDTIRMRSLLIATVQNPKPARALTTSA